MMEHKAMVNGGMIARCDGDGLCGNLSNRTFGCVNGKSGGVVSNRATDAVGSSHPGSVCHVMGDQGVETAGEGVDIAHHPVRSVNHGKMVAEQFLGPATDDMDWSRIFEHLFDGAAIANPIKESAPKEFLIFGDGPSATGRFANKRMEVTFLLSAFPRIETDRTQTGTTHGDVEVADSILEKALCSGDRSGTIIRLHEDGAETICAPIRFQENGLGTVVPREAGAGSYTCFDFVEQKAKFGSPNDGRNRLTVI